MINILIMDDKQDKIDSLCRVIRTHIPEVDLEIQQAQTIVHGTELMQQQQFDLLILDMVMPIRENEDESHTAGTDYLTSIYENQSIKKSSHNNNSSSAIVYGIYSSTVAKTVGGKKILNAKYCSYIS